MIQIGDILKKHRTESRITLQELSCGLCSKSSLSRIENNEQIPSRPVYEALMQKLGQPHDLYPSVMGANEARLYNSKHEILINIADGDDDKVEELLKIFEKEKRLETVYHQFTIYVKAVLYDNKNGKIDEALILYQQSLEKTIKNFDHKKILSYLLTKDEINIINCIAICNFRNGNIKEATDIEYALKKYQEFKYVQMKNYVGTYTMVLLNLAIMLRETKRHNEVIGICDMGIAACIQFNELITFSGLLYTKARSLYDINMFSDVNKYVKEAYSISYVIGNVKVCDIIKKYADKINIQLANYFPL